MVQSVVSILKDLDCQELPAILTDSFAISYIKQSNSWTLQTLAVPRDQRPTLCAMEKGNGIGQFGSGSRIDSRALRDEHHLPCRPDPKTSRMSSYER